MVQKAHAISLDPILDMGMPPQSPPSKASYLSPSSASVDGKKIFICMKRHIQYQYPFLLLLLLLLLLPLLVVTKSGAEGGTEPVPGGPDLELPVSRSLREAPTPRLLLHNELRLRLSPVPGSIAAVAAVPTVIIDYVNFAAADVTAGADTDIPFPAESSGAGAVDAILK